ncbi:MAG: hypothetical protein ABW208_16955, partial [Pyrinomonadaceae bacterium]
ALPNKQTYLLYPGIIARRRVVFVNNGVLGVGFWFLVKTANLPQNLKPNTQHPFLDKPDAASRYYPLI